MSGEIYKRLMAVSDIFGLKQDDAISCVGSLIDLSTDLHREEGLNRAIQWCDQLKGVNLSSVQQATLSYFKGNAWSSLRQLRHRTGGNVWEWEQPELEKEIICLRLAAKAADIPDFPQQRLCQIYTNLGNLLDHIGRFVEAVWYYDKALAIDPNFGMAMGNKGFALTNYGRTLYDHGHASIFLKIAHGLIKEALKLPLEPGASEGFSQKIKWVESVLKPEFLSAPIDLTNSTMGRTKAEKAYRLWCLRERLFINPLNDLGNHPIANRDVLMTPSIVVEFDEGPTLHAFFNALKQEYVSARFLLYDGINAPGPHFSDRDVRLYDTLDYPAYGLATEKIKIAFRMAYSIFDKIAFFLNHYLKLHIPDRQTALRTLWYQEQKQTKPLRPEFQTRQNWPMRGLYWLSKDLYTSDPGFREAIEPEARNLNKYRNHLEHKYLKLHMKDWAGPVDTQDTAGKAIEDSLAFSVYRDDFEHSTISIMRLARAALIYLSLAVHIEERNKSKSPDANTVIVPMHMDIWEDDWKR